MYILIRFDRVFFTKSLGRHGCESKLTPAVILHRATFQAYRNCVFDPKDFQRVCFKTVNAEMVAILW